MANFKVAAVFSNHMVLQRDKNIKVFGQGEDGAKVTVQFMGASYSTEVKQEAWIVVIPPQTAGNGYEMTVNCNNQKKTFNNIAIGEVWLAGGQSNMELELKDCKNGLEMLKQDQEPNVRFYYTQKNAHMNEDFYKSEEDSSWKLFNEEDARCWSAVGYIFGKKLAKELGVTVGIIGCNWGGSSASCWMSEKNLSEDKDLNTYLEEYKLAIGDKTEEEQIKEYQEYVEYHTAWNEKCTKLYTDNPAIEWSEVLELLGENKYPGPKSCINPMRPSGLYHCMVKRIAPYTLRGFIYYQGESDDHKPQMYQKLLTRLIREWREEWEDITLPFLLVQLPMHRYKLDPDYKHWCLIREAQMNTYQTVKNTGIAVALDCGEFNEIHPKDKIPVGERLALQALFQVYHKLNEKDAFGPIYRDYQYRDNKIELSFAYAEEGFKIKGKAEGFEIAGEDKNYVNADIQIDGSKIILSASEISKPMYARYCWTNYGEVTIFGQNGIPLAPFRTSDKA